ncbi:MAG: EAL domain-containing protein [Pseudomonadota bacterium]
MALDASISDFIEQAPYWAFTVDINGRISFLSDNFEALTGLSPRSVMGSDLTHLFVEGPDGANRRTIAEAFAAGQPFSRLRVQIESSGQEPRWTEINGTPVRDSDGRLSGFRGLIHELGVDLPDAVRLEQAGRAIRINETVFHHVERVAKIGAWKFDLRSRTLTWSEEIYRIYGLPVGAKLTLDLALEPYRGAARADLETAMAHTIETGEPYDLIVPFRSIQGDDRFVRALGEAEIIDGEAVTLFGTFQDVTEERNRHEAFRRLAETDSLTDVANRAAFQGLARAAIARAVETQTIGALCLVDLNRFKQINDHFGHAAGDAVLKETSRWLTGLVGEGGQVARLGGDEFALILAGFTSADDLDHVVRERFAALDHSFDFQGRTIDFAASVGYAVFPDDGTCLEDAMARADLALYESKHAGCCIICKYEARFGTAFARRVKLINDFRSALKNDEIVPHYQPIVELETQRLSGFEALARWNHPTRGTLPAGAFLDVFEDRELVAELCTVMLEATFADMARWKADGILFGRVGVNVTDVNLLRPGFALTISAMLGQYGIQPREFVLEVTENTVFKAQEAILDALINLRELGVSIALDDFGTGYSSLTHLQDIPFDILKIDKTFTQGMQSSITSRAIVEAVVQLGNALGYSTVAEGIETETDAAALKALNCERGQGYYFARPMPADEVPALATRLGAVRQTGERVA